VAKSAAKANLTEQEATHRLRAVAGAVGGQESTDSGRLLYDRIRLGIMSALSVNQRLSFAELRDLLGTTDGNLSKHARRLEDAGFVTCKKAFAERVPRTQYSLTAKGKRVFARHLEHMEALIAATKDP
jgi:DNA-binding MarR family transcriptional regulator